MAVAIADIFTRYDHWSRYLAAHKNTLRRVEIREVEKMLNCHSPEKGYSMYWCPKCDQYRIIHHSCNGRLCTKCGKRYTDKWSEGVCKRLLDVTHRHMVFTLSDEIWSLAREDRKIIPLLSKCILPTISEAMSAHHTTITPGVICVTHNFGRDLKFNLHFHCVVTEGGLNERGEWIDTPYIEYESLRKGWQRRVLEALESHLPRPEETAKFIQKMFEEHPNGFYVRAKDRINGEGRLLKYIARYVRHPAIAEGRIKEFDEDFVTFVYKDDAGEEKEVVMEVFEFMEALLDKIPDKGTHLVRSYGLYANKKRRKVSQILRKLGFLKRTIQKTLALPRHPRVRCPVCRTWMEYIETFPPPEQEKTMPIGSRVTHWMW